MLLGAEMVLLILTFLLPVLITCKLRCLIHARIVNQMKVMVSEPVEIG
jgi:hypothetical protein